MLFEAIDRVILPIAHSQKASAPFTRLGLRSASSLDGEGASRCISFGRAENRFHLELAESSGHPLSASIQSAVQEGRGLCGLVLRVRDLQATLASFASKGIAHSLHEVPAGGKWAKLLAIEDKAGVPLILCPSSTEQLAKTEDGSDHPFPILRLDHLAAVATNLDGQTHFWTHVLEIPLFGEVVTPTLVIRQFKIGDAIFELLGPASADSPIHKRAPGLISMMSVEVADLDSACAQAKAAGFSISEPAAGPLPGTWIATIPAPEMSGLAVQLLQYA